MVGEESESIASSFLFASMAARGFVRDEVSEEICLVCVLGMVNGLGEGFVPQDR